MHPVALAEKHSATWVIWLARGAGTLPIRRIVGDPLREPTWLAVREQPGHAARRQREFHRAHRRRGDRDGRPRPRLQGIGRSGDRPVSWDVETASSPTSAIRRTRKLYRELQVPETTPSLRPAGPPGPR